MTMQYITDGLRLPEGPVPMADGSVLLVEVMAGRLARVHPDGGKTVVAELGGGPNGAAIGPDGRCYICNNGGYGPSLSPDSLIPTPPPPDQPPGSIQVVDLTDGAHATLYRHDDAAPFWGPNDLVFDDHGGFWFTDFGRDRDRVRTRGSVYYAHADGHFIAERIHPLESPNGIGRSPDGTTLYVAETYTAHVWRFRLAGPGRIDPTGGEFPNGGSIVGRAGPGAFLDSLAVDGAGNICVASPGRGAILVFPAEGGVPEELPTPDFLTTNIAFGGPGLATAYITLSSSGRLASMPWPRPGLKLAYP